MFPFPQLNYNDQVEIIAPASRCKTSELTDLKNLLESWQLKCVISDDIFGDDLLCANSDEKRFNHIKNALENENNKAVICARGGYGSLRLIPELLKIKPPAKKIFIGMSDITALHIFFQQQWGWPTIHGAFSPSKFSFETITAHQSLLFSEKRLSYLPLKGLNAPAQSQQIIHAPIIGGNLSIIQASIGTKWMLDARNKIIFLEEIGERGYRVDRMLEHLKQTGLFDTASAILLGDFLEGNEPNGKNLNNAVLQRFANECSIPVLQIPHIGHGTLNFPLPLGVLAQLELSDVNQLMF